MKENDLILKTMALDEDAGTLKGLPLAWIQKLTGNKDYSAGGGEHSEVKKIGEFVVNPNVTRAQNLLKLIQQAKPAEDSPADKYLLGIYLRSNNEPFAFIKYQGGDAGSTPFEVLLASGEQIQRTEVERGRSRWSREREVQKKDLSLTQVTGLLPIGEKLEVFAVYTDLEREALRASRRKEREGIGSDLAKIHLEKSKEMVNKHLPVIKDILDVKLKNAVDATLKDISKMFDKIAKERVDYKELNKVRDSIQQIKDKFATVYQMLDDLNDLHNQAIAEPNPYAWRDEEKNKLRMVSDYKDLRNRMNSLLGIRGEE